MTPALRMPLGRVLSPKGSLIVVVTAGACRRRPRPQVLHGPPSHQPSMRLRPAGPSG